MCLLLRSTLLEFLFLLLINMTRFFVKNSLKFDDSNNGDSTDDKEDEESEPKNVVSKFVFSRKT